MMKILVLSDRYPPYYDGGHELICQQAVDGLIEKGHDVTALTSDFGIEQPKTENHVHRQLHFLKPPAGNGLTRRISQFKQIIQARQNYARTYHLAMELKPDFGFAWQIKATTILPALALQDLGINTVFRVGSRWLLYEKKDYVDEPNRLKKKYRSWLLGFRHFEELKLDHVIFVSDSLKKSYLQAGIKAECPITIPNGLPVEWIQEPKRLRKNVNEPLKMVYAGRLEMRKGTDIAVQALSALVKSKKNGLFSLDLIGKGQEDYVKNLKQSIRANSLQKYVNIIDFLPRPELNKKYADYDVFLLPSEEEGFPNSVIEAMAKGLIVISTEIGGPTDIIENGRNGLLVPPNDATKLKMAIEKVFHDPALAVSISSEAIQTVRQKFTESIMMDRYEAVFRSIQ
jgi:glycosyltransferase involved in cell wall biosynthesis